MLDAVLPQDPVEEHLHRRLVEPAGEHLPVIREDLLRHPVGPQCQRQARTDPLGGLPHDHERADTEPGVVIDPGQRLNPAPVGQYEPTHHIHLPQLHRGAALPVL